MKFALLVILFGKVISLNSLGSDLDVEYFARGEKPTQLCYDTEKVGSTETGCLAKTKCEVHHKLKGIEKVYTFGDSYTDDRNVFKLLNRTYPYPDYYCSGKYTDGKMWVNYLQQNLNQYNSKLELVNLAYGGATSNNNLTYTSANRPSVDDQVRTLLPPYLKDPKDLNKSLFIVWLAGNDYFDPKVTPPQVVTELTKTLTFLVEKLKAKNVLVGLMVPLESIPYTKLGNNATTIEIHSKYWKQHNALLKQSLQKFEAKNNLNFGYFEPATTWQHFLDLKTLNNLRWNATHPCLDDVSLPQSYDKLGYGKNSWTCRFPQRRMFWDDFHPTTQVHQELAQRVFKDMVALFK